MKRIPIGSGCKTCPVNPCETLTYRGSTCAAQRAKHGLGDPLTHADRIRAMSDEELATVLYDCDSLGYCSSPPECGDLLETSEGIPKEKCIDCVLAWLRQPAKGE